MSDTETDFRIWDGIYTAFPRQRNPAQGFAEPTSTERSRAAVARLLELVGRGEPARDVTVFNQYPLPIVMALLDENRPVRVLDFGGGLGQTYLSVRATRRSSQAMEYYVLEQEGVARVGRDLFRDDGQVNFVASFDDVPSTVDVVHAASAFQYVDDWQGLLGRFAALKPAYIVFGNMLAGEIEPCVTLQNYWGHKIPVRFHNFEIVVAELETLNYRLVFDAFHEQTILGKRQPLPLSHFPETHRLTYGRNVILKKAK